MLTRVEAQNYRCFRRLDQTLNGFQILVGANGSGKSTFLDVVAFLGDLVWDGVEAAVRGRATDFSELLWNGTGDCFTLAIEAEIPEDRRVRISGEFESRIVRYAVSIRLDPATRALEVAGEEVRVRPSAWTPGSGVNAMVVERERNLVHFRSEDSTKGGSTTFDILGSALASLPMDESRFPAAVWLKGLLRDAIRLVRLDDQALRSGQLVLAQALRSGHLLLAPARQIYDGSNLAGLVATLEKSPSSFQSWVAHLRTAVPDLKSVRSVLREEDKHRYLKLRYQGDLEIPSWAVSDGTLRLLAMTILAYLPDAGKIYLIEEPENGVHPTGLETIFQSLSSLYDGQALLATHSPLLIGLAKPEQLLCFSKTISGTEIIRGDKHPALQDWKNAANLSDFFAAGVLG